MTRTNQKQAFRSGLVLLALLMCPGCLHENVLQPTPVPLEHLNPAYAGTYSGLRDSLRVVVRDAQTFATLWNRAWTYTPAPGVPEVDFATHVVLVVALGERSSGGYSIQVTEVASEGYGLRALVCSTAPGGGCAVTLALTQPVDFVSVPAHGAAVRFVEERRTTHCD
jgi:hypothetical protein